MTGVFSVCSCYVTLPHVFANRFTRIFNLVTKTWYKKLNSAREYNIAPSCDNTSASNDISKITGLSRNSSSIPVRDGISFPSPRRPEPL